MYLLGLTFSPPPMTIYTYEQRSTCFSKWLFPPNRSHHLMSISGWRICLIPAAAGYGCRYPPVGRRLPCIGTRSPSVHVRPEPGPVPLPLLTLSPAGLLHPHSCGIQQGPPGGRTRNSTLPLLKVSPPPLPVPRAPGTSEDIPDGLCQEEAAHPPSEQHHRRRPTSGPSPVSSDG